MGRAATSLDFFPLLGGIVLSSKPKELFLEYSERSFYILCMSSAISRQTRIITVGTRTNVALIRREIAVTRQ